MINRRGFAPWLTCRSCGHHWSCPNCDVSLIVHRHSGRLVCHHCAHAEPQPRACPECASTTLSRAGAGTERIEALLRRAAGADAGLPARLRHRRRARRPRPHPRRASARRRARVLVGTQMVAKGHDFPEVTLSAILDADATLRFPDFRAEERTFAMVAQLAGRSGRGEAGGEVIVQTLAPSAAEHRARRPPRLRRLPRRRARAPPRCSATRPSRTWSGSASPPSRRRGSKPPPRRSPPSCARRCRGGSELLGPAPMFRVRNRHRRRILIKAERPRARRSPRSATWSSAAPPTARCSDVAIGVDVDPQ